MAPIATASDLSVRWTQGGTPDAPATGLALRGVTISIEAGEVVGIVGDTGAGGSTFLRCLNGIVPQLVPAVVDGTLEVCGRDPRTTPVWEMARHVAIVLDDPDAQASQATVVEEVAFGLENLGVEIGDMRDRVHEALEQTGLAGFEERSPLSLSGGEQQRLAVACAIAMRPSLLLLDGPTTNLDPGSGRGLLRLARVLAKERGMAVVIAAHDVELLAEHADRIVVLEAGRIVLDASTEAAFSALARGGAASVPQVTALAAHLDGGTGPLPVTTESAIRWLAARA